MTGSTFAHLRISFSYFLMPIFLLAALLAPRIDWVHFAASFAIIHLLLYPASNAFNSFYDRDTSSIGCLRNPPKVEKALLPVSLALDGAAVIAGCLISWPFAAALFTYGVCSKLYSFDKIRLKRRPIVSWLGTSLVQGGLIFLAVYAAVQPGRRFLAPSTNALLAAGIATLFLMGYYPVTQVYQHAADTRRGDRTISMLLGTRGTFLFSCIMLACASTALCLLLYEGYGMKLPALFALLQVPAAVYLVTWYRSYRAGRCEADYDHTMRFNIIGATGLNLFCLAARAFM